MGYDFTFNYFFLYILLHVGLKIKTNEVINLNFLLPVSKIKKQEPIESETMTFIHILIHILMEGLKEWEEGTEFSENI